MTPNELIADRIIRKYMLNLPSDDLKGTFDLIVRELDKKDKVMRDEIAIQVMHAQLSQIKYGGSYNEDLLIEESYRIADKMIKYKNKEHHESV